MYPIKLTSRVSFFVITLRSHSNGKNINLYQTGAVVCQSKKTSTILDGKVDSLSSPKEVIFELIGYDMDSVCLTETIIVQKAVEVSLIFLISAKLSLSDNTHPHSILLIFRLIPSLKPELIKLSP